MRKLREFRFKDGSGPVVKAETKIQAIPIYEQLGYQVTCAGLRLLRPEDRPKGRRKK